MDQSRPGDRTAFSALFYAGGLLWLPAGMVLQFAYRFGLKLPHPAELLPMLTSIAVCAPLGLFLPLACRRLWRRGYRAVAWTATAVLAPLTVFATIYAGLLGPIFIAIVAAVLSAPVWIASALLPQRE